MEIRIREIAETIAKKYRTLEELPQSEDERKDLFRDELERFTAVYDEKDFPLFLVKLREELPESGRVLLKEVSESDEIKPKVKERIEVINNYAAAAYECSATGDTEGIIKIFQEALEYTKAAKVKKVNDYFSGSFAADMRNFKDSSEHLTTDYEHFPEGETPEDRNILIRGAALTYIAGATGHGKTSLMLNLAIQQVRKGNKILFLTYEEPAENIALKLFSVYFGKPVGFNSVEVLQKYIRAASLNINDELLYEMTGEDFEAFCNKNGIKGDHKENLCKLPAAMKTFANDVYGKTLFVKSLSKTAKELETDIKGFPKSIGLSAVFIDYIQLMESGSGNTRAQRFDEIKAICKMLMDTAKETRLPIVLGAQFNREVNKSGVLSISDIAEGSDIEKSANQIIAIWNGNETPKDSKKGDLENLKNDQMLLKILKNRGGVNNARKIYGFDSNTRVIKNIRSI